MSRMLKFVIVLVIVALIKSEDFTKIFMEYGETHNKGYDSVSGSLLQYRYKTFITNYLEFEARNNNVNKNYKVKVSKYTDMSLEELKGKYLNMELSKELGLKDQTEYSKRVMESKNFNYSPIDWRDEDIFLPARDQGECGSCWAFASVGAIEALRAQEYGVKKYLSPQQLVDCDSKEKGCKGGWPSMAYSYISSNGLVSEDTYPYKGVGKTCDSSALSNIETTIDRKISSCEEDECMTNDLQYNLLKKGPMAIVIDAYHSNFFNYESGYYDESCAEPNHAVMLVGFGYDKEKNIEYWIIRNSWGTSWGMNGYGYVKFDLKNYWSCNINRYGFQPKVLR